MRKAYCNVEPTPELDTTFWLWHDDGAEVFDMDDIYEVEYDENQVLECDESDDSVLVSIDFIKLVNDEENS